MLIEALQNQRGVCPSKNVDKKNPQVRLQDNSIKENKFDKNTRNKLFKPTLCQPLVGAHPGLASRKCSRMRVENASSMMFTEFLINLFYEAC